MSIPDYQSLMRPVLEAAAANASDTSILEISDPIAQQLGLTESDLQVQIPSGTQLVFHNRLHWAKTYLSKAALLQSTKRGRFEITDSGRAFLKANSGPISKAKLKKIPNFADWIGTSTGGQGSEEPSSGQLQLPEVSPELSPDDLIDAGLNQINSQLSADILKELKLVHPKRFEAIVVHFLQAMGFGGQNKFDAKVTSYSNDGGIDGIIHEDALGLDAIYIQAKRYTDSVVGQPEVQQFVGSMDGLGAHKGVFVTTSSFSSQASSYAKRTSKRVVLIDGQRLANLFLKYGVGVRTKRAVEIRTIDPDYFLGE